MLDVVALGADANIVTHLLRNLATCTLCKGVHRKIEAQVNAVNERFRERVLGYVVERGNGNRDNVPRQGVGVQEQGRAQVRVVVSLLFK